VEHDAHLVAEVEELASIDESQPHPFGARFWVITRDRHLVDGARAAAASPAKSNVMLAEEWIQYIAPFLAANTCNQDTAGTFAGLLSSRFIPSLGLRMTLSELQLFAEPSVAKLTAGLSADDACRAVSEAHREAVMRAGNQGRRSDAVAIERLAVLAEKKLRARVDGGELVEAERLEQLRRARQAEANNWATDQAEKDHELEILRRQLRDARAYQRSSLAYLYRAVREWAKNTPLKLKHWVRQHPIRLAAALAVLALVMVIEVTGAGGRIVQIAGLIAVPLSILAIDFGQARRNFLKLIGRCAGSDQP
jgi:hypothetical protein